MRLLFTFMVLIGLSSTLLGQSYLSEDFEQGIPYGWSAESCWAFGDSTSLSSPNFSFGQHTKFAAVNDDRDQNAFSQGGLITKEIDLTNANHIIFSFDFFFLAYEDEEFSIEIQRKNGAWGKYPKQFHGCHCWRNIILDLSDYAGSIIKIKFDYSDGDNWNFGVGLDNVIVREAIDLEGFFYRLDPSKKRIASRDEIEYNIGFCSIGAKPLKNININFDGNGVHDVHDIDNMNFFDSIELHITNLDIDSYLLKPSVWKGNQQLIYYPSINFELFPSIPAFTQKDIDGENFDLHDVLYQNKPTLLYFTATWCDDCHQNIPFLNNLKKDYPNTEIVAIYLDVNATKKNIESLNLKEEFPSFGFSQNGKNLYYLLSQGYEKSLPFTALICPDTNEPQWSEISYSTNSWKPGTEDAIYTFLNNCVHFTSNKNENLVSTLKVSPNPTDRFLKIDLRDTNLTASESIDIHVFNLFGQQQSIHKDMSNNKILLDFNQLQGIFFLKIQIGNQSITKKVEIF